MEHFDHFIDLSNLMRVHRELFHLELTFRGPTALSETATSLNPIELNVKIPPELMIMLGMQLDICLTSGFGEFLITTDRSQKDKVRLLMRAGKSYNLYIPDRDFAPVVHWLQQIQKHI